MDISRRALIVSPEPPKKHKKKKKSKNSDLDLTVAGDLVNGILTPESSSPSPKKRRKRSRGDSLTETLTQEESGSPRVGEATESLPSPSKKKHMNSESSNLLSPARKLLQSPTKKNQKDSESNNLQSTTMESLSSPTKKKRKGSQSSSEQSPTEESFSSPTKKTQKDSESSNLSTKHKKTSKRKASENGEEEVSGDGKKEKDVKGLEIPKDVEKLQAKYEAKLPEPHIPCTKFPIAPRKKLQSNWNKVFKKLDHPDPGSLFRPRKKAKEAAEEYLKENKIYKKLFKGINVDPVTIYKVMMKHIREFDLEKCLDELFDDNESCKEAVRPLIQERLDNLEITRYIEPIDLSLTRPPPTLSQLAFGKEPQLALAEIKSSFNMADAIWLFHATVRQKLEPLWHTHRLGRITASKMHRVYHFMKSKHCRPHAGLLKDIFRCLAPMQSLSSWGDINEPVAVQAYIDQRSRSHKEVKVTECGLWFNPDSPHLGASSDGLVTCACCPPRLLEVKCPQSSFRGSVSLYKNNTISPENKYYGQIQAQMGLMDIPEADLVIWSPQQMLVIPVTFDPTYWADMKDACNVGGVDFTPKNILTMAEIRFMIPVVRQLLSTGNSLKTKDTWLKLVLLFPARSIHVLKSAWFGTAQWMVNAAMEDCKPFSYQERLTLINSVEKEGCEEEDLKWKTINKSFTGRSSKDLRYFWKCLKHHCPLTKTEDTTANILLHLHNTLVPKMKAEVERKMKSGAALLKKLNFHKKRVERYQKQLEAAQERLATSQNVLQQVQRSVDSYEMVISLEEKQDNEVEPSSESQE